MTPLSPRSARHRFLVLRGLRWLPTGLLIPILVLLMVDRGLTLAQIGAVTAAQGVLVLLLELPTGGLADAIGRRPVLLAATVIEIGSMVLLTVADSLTLLVLVFALQGVYRALESGPLDAWYVDAALTADPKADIERGLSQGGVVLGMSIATGALLAGGIVALDPIPGVNPLVAPVFVAIVLRLVELTTMVAVVQERRSGSGAAALWHSARRVPTVVGDAIHVVRRSSILLALVSVELFWGFGMATFEMLLPPRLAEVVGDTGQAGALLGPAASAAWLASAAGAALIPLATRRFGAPLTGAGLRVLQGGTVVAMGLAAGPAGLLAAYLATYAVHGAANPVHQGLLHRRVSEAHRTSVLSLNSMTGLPAAAAGGVALGWLADRAGISAAMIVGGVILALAAPLYLPARRSPHAPDDS